MNREKRLDKLTARLGRRANTPAGRAKLGGIFASFNEDHPKPQIHVYTDAERKAAGMSPRDVPSKARMQAAARATVRDSTGMHKGAKAADHGATAGSLAHNGAGGGGGHDVSGEARNDKGEWTK